jgi:hypothetical protein
VYIKLVVLLRNYVTMMHGQQNIKNGWATIVVVGRLRVKTAVTVLAKVWFWFLRQIDFQTLNIYSFRLLANVKEQYCLVDHRLCWQNENTHIIWSENLYFGWNFQAPLLPTFLTWPSTELKIRTTSGKTQACHPQHTYHSLSRTFQHLCPMWGL